MVAAAGGGGGGGLCEGEVELLVGDRLNQSGDDEQVAEHERNPGIGTPPRRNTSYYMHT